MPNQTTPPFGGPQPTTAGSLSSVWDRNEVILGDTAKKWLGECDLLPTSWNIPSEEWARIRSQQIFLTVTTIPAGTLSIKARLKGLDDPKLVVLDLSLVKARSLTQQEAVAMILHEFGHVLNPPAPVPLNSTEDLINMAAQGTTKTQRAEMYADDYARHCGYGDHVASGLEKLAQVLPQHFGTADVQRRVQRIKDGEEPKLNLIRA